MYMYIQVERAIRETDGVREGTASWPSSERAASLAAGHRRRENLGPGATDPAGFTLSPPTQGTARFPHGTRTLSVSETYVSLGGEHHLFTVHYQPLLLSPTFLRRLPARLDRSSRAAHSVPGYYRLGSPSQRTRCLRRTVFPQRPADHVFEV